MSKTLHQPLGGNEMPRFGGPATMMRLPTPAERQGPRRLLRRRAARHRHLEPRRRAVRAAPDPRRKLPDPALQHGDAGRAVRQPVQVADIGDVAINTFNLQKSIDIIEAAYDEILSHGCKPLTMGGDHTIVLPILRAMRRKHGPVGLVHVDAHADVNDTMFGEKIAHGTPFRRCVEEGLLDGKRVVQIGLRGTGYTADDFDWPRQQGFRVVQAEECWHKSLTPLMAEVREQVGGGPVYFSFDIDGLDPSYARRAPARRRSAASPPRRRWRSSAAAAASTWSAAIWSRCRRPTIPSATPR